MTVGGAQPLSGIKVLDLTQALYGALASQLRGRAGADVVKIELQWGDFMRLARLGANSIEVLRDFSFDAATVESLLPNGFVFPAEE